MVDQPANDCKAEFQQAMPAKPWTADMPVPKFEPLINLIEGHTQADLFRHEGAKYAQNGDYYEIAHDLANANQKSGKSTFENGVTAQVDQVGGWPSQIILEDKSSHLKETVKLDPFAHRILSDKVEYCGVSRERLFSEYGEKFRSYNFPGGSVEKSGPLPVLKLHK